MPHRRRAEVVRIVEDHNDTTFLEVQIADSLQRAVNYSQLTGPVNVGDEVIVNTIGVDLQLGSGGYHFVVANLTRPAMAPDCAGHIVKLRYTPLQTNVLAVEEESSPHHQAMLRAASLDGMPVVVATLHSMIAPIAAGMKVGGGEAVRVIYLMTDSAALPIGFSRLVRALKEAKLIDATITVGQAFGGDCEAVNVYSGMLAARFALNADAVVVAPGVGHVGTGTPFGFSGIEQASILDGVNALRGRAVAALRVSFADERERQRGVSHHSLTTLGRLTQTRATVVLPELIADEIQLVRSQLAAAHVTAWHDLAQRGGAAALAELERKQIPVTSMGRRVEQDRAFFLAGGAAGEFAGELVVKRERSPF